MALVGFTGTRRDQSFKMARLNASSRVVPAAYVEQLRRSYGSLTSPKRHFVLDVANHEPFTQVLHELSELAPVEDDTDVNCDVSFTLVLASLPPLVIKLSMVGPYAVVLLFGDDGLAPQGRLLVPHEPHGMGDVVEKVFLILSNHGFIFPGTDSLEAPVPIALADNGGETSLYSALFEPEGEIPWLDRR
jgi:hypothetical protein